MVLKDIIAIIAESGAGQGDLIYVRSAGGAAIPGAYLTTAPDLLGLKVEAMKSDRPLVATGPATNEEFADIVIDADTDTPRLVKHRANGKGNGAAPKLEGSGEL